MKRFFVLTAVIALGFIFSQPARAERYSAITRVDLTPFSLWEAGYEFSYYEYSEPGYMKDKGYFNGLFGRYTRHTVEDVMWQFEGGFSMGQIDYDGSTWGGDKVTTEGDDLIINFRGLLGYDFPVNQSVVTPYIGLGYRYLNDELRGSGAYERRVKYLYGPLGLQTASPAGDSWIWGIKAEYDFLISGKVKSYLSDVSYWYGDPVTYSGSKDGYGARASLYFRRPQNVSWPVGIEFFVRYWDLNKTDAVSLTYMGYPTGLAVYEPDNHTTTGGVRVSYLW